jgi:tetratricopeptide (TPR) repeat protein
MLKDNFARSLKNHKEQVMKQKISGTAAGVILGIFGLAVLALPLFTQTNFNMDEKRLVESHKRANPLYLAGAKLFAKGDLDKAEKKVLAALEIMPEHADAMYVLAQIQLKRKDLPRALAFILDAKKNYAFIAGFHTFTHQQYLDRLRQQRQSLEAQRMQILDNISRLPAKSRPDSTPGTQAITRSIQEIDQRLSQPVPPTFEIPADYHFIHGNVLFQMGKRAEAEAQYQEAIRVDPSHGRAYTNLALVLFSLGRYQEALDCLLRAEGSGVQVNPDFKRDLLEKIPRQ